MESFSRSKLFFATLYFLQGAVLAYLLNFQKPFLFYKGVSPSQLGLFTSSLLIPFVLKIFLGLLSDSVPWGKWGARKPYMLIGLGLFVLGYLGLSQIDPRTDFGWFWLISFVAVMGLALFDTSADGWAVDVTPVHQSGSIQAAMLAGRSLGLLSVSVSMSALTGSVTGDWERLDRVFFVLAGLGVLVAVVVMVARVPRSLSKPSHSWLESVWKVRRELSWDFAWFALFGVVYSIASFGTEGLLTLHLSETKGAGVAGVGEFGTAKGLGALVGALSFGYWVGRCGLRRLVALSLALLGLGCLVPLASSAPLWIQGSIWGGVWGMQETAYFTLAMLFARGSLAATMFAVCMIFSNLGTAVGEALGGQLRTEVGYEATFVAFAVLAWLSWWIVRRIPMNPT